MDPDPSTIRSTILDMLAGRDPGATICPSEVARALRPDGWRTLMPDVRDAARALAREGRVVVTQRGAVLSPDADWRGPVRIGLG